MKLHEEFKEYENLWEAPTAPNFIRTLAGKDYNLKNHIELKAFIDDSLKAEVAKNPAKYANDNFYRDAYWRACYNIFQDLIDSFKKDPNSDTYYKNLINKLDRLRSKYLEGIHDTNNQNIKAAKGELAKVAEQHVKNFIADLHNVGVYDDYSGNNVSVNLRQSYMPEAIEEATDALIRLGKSLLGNYWTP